MLTLYGRRNSSNSAKIFWLLDEMGLDYALIATGRGFAPTDNPEFQAMNPHQRVPVIKDGDQILWESHAILRYLASRYGPTPLWPEDMAQRGNIDRWLDWVAISFAPVLTRLRKARASQPNRQAEEVDLPILNSAMKILDHWLADHLFLSGDQLSLADIAAAPSIHRWSGLPESSQGFSHIASYALRLAAIPGFCRHIRDQLDLSPQKSQYAVPPKRRQQHAVPFLMLRGGTSRGCYFAADHLPQDRQHLARILISVFGAKQIHNIDGIGGGITITNKAAILSQSTHPQADINYLFAQIAADKPQVDFTPSCGNILSGVGPAAIEMGLFPAQDDETRIRIHCVNTGALVECLVQTPNGQVTYEGDLAIDGIEAKAAPINLNFRDIVGSVTGKLWPSGDKRNVIDGIEVSCLDVGMPVVIARAQDFGLTGSETAAELDANVDFNTRREAIRLQAGQLMGLGDVAEKVTPKFAIIGKPRNSGVASVRYFMPARCHPTLAVTGAQCLATSLLLPGSIAQDFAIEHFSKTVSHFSDKKRGENKKREHTTGSVQLCLEHPSGFMDIVMDCIVEEDGNKLIVRKCGVVRTARLLVRGEVMIPVCAWDETCGLIQL